VTTPDTPPPTLPAPLLARLDAYRDAVVRCDYHEATAARAALERELGDVVAENVALRTQMAERGEYDKPQDGFNAVMDMHATIVRLRATLAEYVADRERLESRVDAWEWLHWGHPEAGWVCRACGMVNGSGINQCFGEDGACGTWRPMKPAILTEVQAGANYDAALVEKHRAFRAPTAQERGTDG
jgi:hypothetical protein